MIQLKYYLKQKNNLVAEANFEENKDGMVDMDMSNEVIHRKDLLPFDFVNMKQFIATRKPLMNRAFVINLLASIGTMGYPVKHIDVTLGLSLNDTYWILPEKHKNLKYEDYSLYDNDFSEALSVVAFTGKTNPVNGINTSPEYTTSGILRKCWKRDGTTLKLYKSGTEGFANAGMEPYSEYFACQVAKALEIKYVNYDLETYKNTLVSTSECFCSKDKSLATIHQLMFRDKFVVSGWNAIKRHVELFGEQAYLEQLVFDYVIYNYDRHLNNFGVYYDPDTLEILGSANIYDNGIGLLSNTMKSDFENQEILKKWLNEHPHANGFSFDKLMEHFNNSRAKMLAMKLLGFKLRQHPLYKIPEWRLEELNKFIQSRVQAILKG